jgi:hypothetical protein
MSAAGAGGENEYFQEFKGLSKAFAKQIVLFQ